MSVPFDDLSTLVQNQVMPTLINNIYESSAIAYRFLKGKGKGKKYGYKKWSGGKYYEVPVTYAKNTNAEAFAKGATLATTLLEEFTKARYYMKRYNVSIRLDGGELAQNKGKTKVLDLTKSKLENAETSLIDLFGTHFFTGGVDGDSKIGGLNIVCGDSVYAGINYGDVAKWKFSSDTGRASHVSSGDSVLTPERLSKLYNNSKIDADQPTLCVTTDDIWTGLETNLIQSKIRYADEELKQIGVESIKYRNALVVTDSHVPSGYIYMLNEKHLYFAIFPEMNFKFIPFQKEIGKDETVSHIRWYGALACDARWLQGLITDISSVSDGSA